MVRGRRDLSGNRFGWCPLDVFRARGTVRGKEGNERISGFRCHEGHVMPLQKDPAVPLEQEHFHHPVRPILEILVV